MMPHFHQSKVLDSLGEVGTYSVSLKDTDVLPAAIHVLHPDVGRGICRHGTATATKNTQKHTDTTVA
jgi:hypothetical protein